MRIASVPNGITWKEFREKYSKFFRISYAPKLQEVMAKEYTRLTGREAKDDEVKPKKSGSSHYKPKPVEKIEPKIEVKNESD